MGNLMAGNVSHTADNVRRVVPGQVNHRFHNNHIKTTKYNVFTFLPKNLFEQFHRLANLYFIFIVCINFVPQLQAFGKEIAMIPVIGVLSVTCIKDAYEDYRRYNSDKTVNTSPCKVFDRLTGNYEQRQWQDIIVGDIIRLSCNEVIPADMLLLHTSHAHDVCYIETANIDGESNLKQREVAAWSQEPLGDFKPSSFQSTIECELPNPEIYKFHGAVLDAAGQKVIVNQSNIVLRGCLLRNTDFVEGVVVYAGHETKALLNNQGPRYKRSALERRINKDIVWCVVILIFMCLFGAVGSGIWMSHFQDTEAVIYVAFSDHDRFEPAYQGFLVFWTFIIILQVMIPLPLYVSIEFIKLGQAYFITHDIAMYDDEKDLRMQCRALNINEELGQIQYVFSDKTGTLTENKMVFKKCTIGGADYPHPDEVDESMRYHQLEVNPDLVIPNADLHSEMSRMSLHTLDNDDVQLDVPYQSKRIHEFFLLMAVCNTVFVSPHSHIDGLYQSQKNIAVDNFSKTASADHGYMSNHSDQENGSHRNSNHNNGGIRFTSSQSSSDIPYTVLDDSVVTDSSILSIRTLKTRYEAESPDELALVNAACSYGCRLLRRSGKTATVWLPADGEVDLDILNVLPFDSNRKRMSVIVRHPLSRDIVMYCKGADLAIVNNLSSHFKDNPENSRMIADTMQYITQYAKDGLRTLCMAKKPLTEKEYETWLESYTLAEQATHDRESKLYDCYCHIETNLQLLGATGIEDRLQDGVPETIASLRSAGMSVWVLTGDKQETAINIAYSCKLISYEQEVILLNAESREDAANLLQLHIEQTRRDSSNTNIKIKDRRTLRKLNNYDIGRELALVIDGRTLQFYMDSQLTKNFLQLAQKCHSVVCCRATPGQKAAVVKLVRDKLDKITLAIGDGANDVAMIQTANVGVGIAGQEGMQAVMSSDFSIARFRFLERLLLVHGHWCYDRLATMALYMFYKNSAFVFLLFWYQLFNGFSGTTMIDQFYLILYSVLFTSMPAIVLGILDRDAPSEILLSTPSLYKQGQCNQMYQTHSYWVNIADALYQSLVTFFIPYMVYADSDRGIWEFGTTITTCSVYTVLIHLAIETKSWTWIHWFIMALSFMSYWTFALAYNAACVSCSNSGFDPYWVMEYTLQTSVHWFTVGLTTITALLPRLSARALQGSILPPAIMFTRWWSTFTHNPLQEEDDDTYVAYSSTENECTLTGFHTIGDGKSDAIDCKADDQSNVIDCTAENQSDIERDSISKNAVLA